MKTYYVTAVVVVKSADAQSAVDFAARMLPLDFEGEPILEVVSEEGDDTKPVTTWRSPATPATRVDVLALLATWYETRKPWGQPLDATDHDWHRERAYGKASADLFSALREVHNG